jgi:hypothetical protein
MNLVPKQGLELGLGVEDGDSADTLDCADSANTSPFLLLRLLCVLATIH